MLYGAWLCTLVGWWAAADVLPTGWILQDCEYLDCGLRVLGIDKASFFRPFALDSTCTRVLEHC